MAQIKIYGLSEKLTPVRELLSDTIHECVVEALQFPADDPAQLKAYQTAVPPIVAQYRGKFIARGGTTVTLEGPAELHRIVVIEFPELSDVQAFYHSPEYTEARKLREGIARFEAIAVDGIKL